MVPLRLVFRSRWAALAWAAGICWTAMSVAGDPSNATVNAAAGADDPAAIANSLAAEDPAD